MTDSRTPRAVVKPRHVQPLWAGHPWVFAQAIARLEGEPASGAEVLVTDPTGKPLGRALYAPGSAIPLRLYSRDPHQPFDGQLLRRKLSQARQLRRDLGLPDDATTGYRWLHGEGDGLPGLIVDRLGNALALQLGSPGLRQRQELICDVLEELEAPQLILDRTPATGAAMPPGGGTTTTDRAPAAASGAPSNEILRGEASAQLTFRERGFEIALPLGLTQKTGYYFDQRPLRERVEALAAGRRVLDCHCYVGSVALAAARGGASSVSGVDRSRPALDAARALAQVNGYPAIRFRQQDAYEALVQQGREEPLDLVIVDPPKLAPNRAARPRALAHMRRLAAAAARAVRPGGLVILSSCSAALDVSSITRSTALGARDAERRAVVLERLFQGADHPVPAAFPEGTYLSTIVFRSET